MVEPQDGKNIEDVLGSNLLDINQRFTNLVRVTGYPTSSDQPVTCINLPLKGPRKDIRPEPS